ncbi:MAG: aminomethyltransferase beta-barrel domain-containing protein, partial [Henriciella sp.]
VGQRRGLGVATGEPLFVVKIDAAKRQVIVGPREALRIAALQLEEINWLGEDTIHAACAERLEVLARVRSTRAPLPAYLTLQDGQPSVRFKDAEEGVARGQACVLYDASDETRVLGGGFIAQTEATFEAEQIA